MDSPSVKDVTIRGSTTLDGLLRAYEAMGGFTARLVADGARILRRMKTEECTVFLAFPAAPVATGLRGVLTQLVASGFVDVVVTTCGTLDHDIARSYADYHQGAFEMDDVKLGERGIHRLGNLLVPEKAYGPVVEEQVKALLDEQWGAGVKRFGSVELGRWLGERLPEGSLLKACADREVPVFVPGLTDGAVGNQLWMFSQNHDLWLDLLADEKKLADVVYAAEKTGALIVGGGIAKHHTIWWNQYREGLDYAVYVTTAPEWDGSLSGARMREGISWGKVRPDAQEVTIPGDATVILPLLAAAVLD